LAELGRFEFNFLLLVGHETADEVGDLVGGGVEGEVAGVENVNLGLGDVVAVSFRLAYIK
jgi:hypothetical protein